MELKEEDEGAQGEPRTAGVNPLHGVESWNIGSVVEVEPVLGELLNPLHGVESNYSPCPHPQHLFSESITWS